MWSFIRENWISLIALIISIISFFKENIKDMLVYKKNKKEEKSAKITISYINDELIISNKGKSIARNVKIYVDNKEIKHNNIFATFAKDMDFSILTPNNSFGIKSVTSLDNSKRNFNIKVEWEDDNSKNNCIEDVINI